jgi:hypothetical protein
MSVSQLVWENLEQERLRAWRMGDDLAEEEEEEEEEHGGCVFAGCRSVGGVNNRPGGVKSGHVAEASRVSVR